MKYKVGDKVRIKSRYKLSLDTCIVSQKLGYANLIATIVTADCGVDGNDEGCKIDLDKKEWWWFDFEFEDLYNPEKSIITEEIIKDIAEVVKRHNFSVCIDEKEENLIIAPLEVEEEDDLPIDTPCMCSNSLEKENAWFVRYYAGNKQTWWELGKSNNEHRKVDWNCIIPCEKFNFENPEESLKYNIVKQ